MALIQRAVAPVCLRGLARLPRLLAPVAVVAVDGALLLRAGALLRRARCAVHPPRRAGLLLLLIRLPTEGLRAGGALRLLAYHRVRMALRLVVVRQVLGVLRLRARRQARVDLLLAVDL